MTYVTNASQEIEILKDELYFCLRNDTPPSTDGTLYFTAENQFSYNSFATDYGPLCLGDLHRFCKLLDKPVKRCQARKRKMVYFTSQHVHNRVNAAYMLAAYCALNLGMEPKEACRFVQEIQPPLLDFRDANGSEAEKFISVEDCVHALLKAREYRLFEFSAFNTAEYYSRGHCFNGDMHWVFNKKLLACRGPRDTPDPSLLNAGDPPVARHFHPADYAKYFVSNNVKGVVRLNEEDHYDPAVFTKAGVKHYDLAFIDGGAPSDEIVDRFLHIVESTRGAVAVHCRQGLGRTGTLIAAFLMKHFRFTAREATAYTRICRPGSIVDIQQHFLEECEQRLWDAGEEFRSHGELIIEDVSG